MEDNDSKVVHDLIDKIGNVIDGANMGHVIPALIYLLATSQSNEIMSEEHFVKSVAEDLFNWFVTFKKAESTGGSEWLQ
jgi:hypothetical protein